MAFSGYVSSLSPSMTAMKYHRQGYVEKRPFLPGERYSVAREMENNMKGFREVSRNLSISRREAENQERVRQSASMDRTPTTSYYKSVVGTRYGLERYISLQFYIPRSSKGSGGIFYCEQVGRIGTFSSSRRL